MTPFEVEGSYLSWYIGNIHDHLQLRELPEGRFALIDEGGMGQVWQAHDMRCGRDTVDPT